MANRNRLLRLFAGMGLLAMSAFANDTFVHESAGNLMSIRENNQFTEHFFGSIGLPRKATRMLFMTTVSVRAGTYHPADVFPSNAFCLGDTSTRSLWAKYLEDLQQKQAAGIVADNYPYPRKFFTEYVLRTGALWAGPIKDFELIIRKSSPTQLVSTCFSGPQKTS